MVKVKQIAVKMPGLLLGVVFLMSGFAKIADMSAFHDTISAVSFLPFFIKGSAVVFLPGLEITLGLILIFNKELKKSASLLACLFFLTAVTFSLYTALSDKEGCGSCFKLSTEELNYQAWKAVVLNSLFLGLAVITIFLSNQTKKK